MSVFFFEVKNNIVGSYLQSKFILSTISIFFILRFE